MRTLTTGVLVLSFGGATAPLHAQLTDLQPGSNYGDAVQAFGTGKTGGVALGDVDLDGDLDVALANGGTSKQVNELYLNLGGAQAGVEGAA